MKKKINCMACEEAEKEPFTIMQYKDFEIKLIMEMHPDGMRLHLTNGKEHITQRIFNCPFCGSEFEDK